PRVLGMYENYPFWFTMLTKLGFRVMISGRSNHALFEGGMESIPSENVCYPAKLVHGHIEALLKKGVTNIFYPCVAFEQGGGGADNCFNCPVVATYPEVIRNNMERLSDPGVRFISPFVNFSNREYLPAHLVGAFKEHGYDIPLEEMEAALDAAWEEDAAVKAEIRQKGRESLEWMRAHGVRGIVLAGRPYHLDPEINHGIPEVIVGLGMAVLTEDSVIDDRLERPLRVRDQWTYHSRLYEAAARVGDEPDLEMVQLNSFGCGVDAITADQVQEILEGRGDVHTVLKIDEVSNLGAARIRLRSLEAAVAERCAPAPRAAEAEAVREGTASEAAGREEAEAAAREGTASEAAAQEGAAPASSTALVSAAVDTALHEDPASAAAREERAGARAGHIEVRASFTKEMREAGYEILAPQMSPIHFRFLAPLLARSGLRVRLLERTSRRSTETGLKYVNNDSCYPAI
ncbi:MAG: 2-hydroxyacyl-CoA dehydratase, partial [Schaalia georgiae]|nr:2-hydroxyacyl-CoA dehydratase [Schaalia georgiae]